MEMNFGDWEGKAWSDIDKEELNSWMIDFVNNPAKNGENFLKMFKRVKLFIDELILENQHTNKPIFIFTHAGVIRCFVAYLLEIPLNNAFKIPIDIASVTSITLNADKNYNKINYLNS